MAPPSPAPSASPTDRQALRSQFLADREAFAASPQAPQAQRALAAHLQRLLADPENGQSATIGPYRNRSPG